MTVFSYVSHFDKLLGDNDFYLLKDVDLHVQHAKFENQYLIACKTMKFDEFLNRKKNILKMLRND